VPIEKTSASSRLAKFAVIPLAIGRKNGKRFIFDEIAYGENVAKGAGGGKGEPLGRKVR